MSPVARFTTFLITCGGLIAAASAAPVAQGGKTFTVAISGANEVNAQGVPNQGDPDAMGSVSLFINPGQKRICYDITLTGVDSDDAITMAHIHEAPAGQNGPPVITLFTGTGPLEGCADATSRQLAQIIAKPTEYYFNIHSEDFGPGIARGQLSR